MFGIGMGEFAVILAVALVMVGPDDLPKVARWLAKTLRFIRNTIKQISETVNLDEEIREVKEAGSLLRETVHDINPIAGITDELEATKRETKEAFNVLGDLVKEDLKVPELPGKTGGTEPAKTIPKEEAVS